ncbi:MAG: hypothetical protein [Bacteriophage sp.]|nr:MAG: hypothetical protein [Bacteriophage sp.]
MTLPAKAGKIIARLGCENLSCKPVTLYRVAGFFFCHSARRAAHTARLTAFGSLKNSLFTLFHLFSGLIHPGGALGSGRFAVRPVKVSGGV